MREYGLSAGAHPDFEIDHLVPPGIGGADDDANLWPEPRRWVERAWSAEHKDELERKLRELVCGGALDVRQAQSLIVDGWTEAYRRYVRSNVGETPEGLRGRISRQGV